MEMEGCLIYAAGMLELSTEQQVQVVRQLRSQWGELDGAILLRIAQHEEGDKCLFALFALGCLDTPAANAYLVSLLQSADERKRVASAVCLGCKGERAAIPELIDMLRMPIVRAEDQPDAWREWVDRRFFGMWQGYVPVLLGQLGSPEAIVPLRTALEATLQIANSRWPPPADSDALDDTLDSTFVQADVGVVSSYQDTIVYALGRLEAVGALLGLSVAGESLQFWTVHLLMGTLHRQYPRIEILRWEEMPLLREELDSLLERIYGWSVGEREAALAHYERGGLSMLAEYSYAESLAQERGIYF